VRLPPFFGRAVAYGTKELSSAFRATSPICKGKREKAKSMGLLPCVFAWEKVPDRADEGSFLAMCTSLTSNVLDDDAVNRVGHIFKLVGHLFEMAIKFSTYDEDHGILPGLALDQGFQAIFMVPI
jgi:hypothetical protein